MSLWTEQHGGHLVPDSGTFHEVMGEESLIRVQEKLRTENNHYVEFDEKEKEAEITSHAPFDLWDVSCWSPKWTQKIHVDITEVV